MSPLLEVDDLHVQFETEDGIVKAVDGVSFSVDRGKVLGIVGESGSGKSVSMLTVMGLSRARNATITGAARFDGQDLLKASNDDLRGVRGNDVAMIFQDPLSSLHPFYKVGKQLVEGIQSHQYMSKAQARQRAIEYLGMVGIPDPARRFDSYPHEFSGGMRQRAMIAMALVNEPRLLIADEPTTALDVTIQAQILELLERLQRDLGMAIMLITHDLGVVAGTADRVVVMYAGQVVETATTTELFARPRHPYTEGLMAAVPRVDTPREQLRAIPGSVPAATEWPTGCRFHPRCPHAWDKCRSSEPPLLDAGSGHQARCWLVTEPARRSAAP